LLLLQEKEFPDEADDVAGLGVVGRAVGSDVGAVTIFREGWDVGPDDVADAQMSSNAQSLPCIPKNFSQHPLNVSCK